MAILLNKPMDSSARQRSDHKSPSPSPYTFPIQQQPQGSWTPSIAAAPFYPAFFQGQQQQPVQPYPGQLPPQAAYFDPAQWAYQQMMFNAQHAFQRTASSSSSSNPADYFNPYPQAPPPQVQRSQSADHHQGFHPYRRPNRQQQQQHHSYARPDPSASSSSVNSSSSGRPRTNSNQSGHSGHNVPSSTSISRSRNSASPNPSSSNSARTSPAVSSQRLPHNATSSRPSQPAPSAPTTATTITHRLARPSPLSQGSTYSTAEKRMSRDDSDIAAMLESTSKASSGMSRGGLKGRLRRALSFNALKEEDDNNNNDNDDDDESIKASNFTPKGKGKLSSLAVNSGVTPPETAGAVRSPDLDETESTAPTVQTKKKSRAASLFNSRLNASTDNISLSSTVSSASVMIRKLGSMGKLVVRRNSLAGITSIFKDKSKDKDKDKDGDKTKKKDKKSAAKTPVVQAEVSHVHAELDRTIATDPNGLSPAAELARQHTLKTKAENAARIKAQQEAQAAADAAAAAAASASANGSSVPTWDKNTATRAGTAGSRSGNARVSEDGTRVVIEDEDEDSDDGQFDHANNSYNMDGWDDDEDWDVPEDEDVTIRMDMSKARISGEQEDHEPWAMDLRRSVERTRRPMRGILKNAGLYDQARYFNEQPIPIRTRSNSYNSPGQTELGPLARIPSPDPDHIDGLHRHNSHSSGHTVPPTIPPLRFESSPPPSSAKDIPDTHPHTLSERPSSIFQHPALNSSAPALSMVPSSAPTLAHRAATAPPKRLAFATNLSVYDTFSSTVYDRRSEPATWSRLTPALAQRIKEELNSYKMEEMEVHAASRVHTQFFV